MWVLPANLVTHWLFRVGAEPHFSRLEQFPTINKQRACEDVEKGEPFCPVGGSADWCTPNAEVEPMWKAV